MPRVVKIGGRAQSDPALPAALRACREDGLCVVHGGGDEVSVLQRRLGLEPQFLGGRRVTSTEDLDVVRMVLSGTTNKRITAQLIGAGLRAVGVSGEDGGLFTAEVTDARMGRVGGRIMVDATLVRHLLAGGFVPVVSPLARDVAGDGAGLNVNGDDAAAALAVALEADDLVLVADVPGVLGADGAMIAALDLDAAHALIDADVAKGGMAAKIHAAAHALRGGVPSVRIAGVDGIANRQGGTRITTTATVGSRNS